MKSTFFSEFGKFFMDLNRPERSLKVKSQQAKKCMNNTKIQI